MPDTAIVVGMSMRCFLGLHRPSLGSIARKSDRDTAICEHCTRPLEKLKGARWRAAAPLYLPAPR